MKEISRTDLGFAGACVALSLIAAILSWQSPVARTLLKGERISGLLIGSDYEDNTRHSDTLMYLSYDPRSRFLDVLSIPRDTHVSLPDRPAIRRVNEIFAYEFRHSGKDFNLASMALKGYVETLLSSGSVQALEIPYYFTIDYASFRALIDAMGGVYVKVTEPMNYDDNWGHLHIHFQPGTYLMDGRTALLYVRYRGANADQGRVLRQQIFIKNVLKRLKNPAIFWNLPEYGKVVLSGVHTNFSVWDMFCLLTEATHMKWKNLRLFSVPGIPMGNLWKMNPEMTHRILDMMQVPVSRTASPIVQPLAATPTPLDHHGVSTVEVWNASNYPRIMPAVVKLLRENGFDVVKYGPFKTRQQRTLVIDRSGHLRPAQAVADVLVDAHPEVVSRIDLRRMPMS